jgi:hypothetical protein
MKRICNNKCTKQRHNTQHINTNHYDNHIRITAFDNQQNSTQGLGESGAIIMSNVVILIVAVMSVVLLICAERRCVKCSYSKRRYSGCPCAECRYTGCRYTGCRYTGCRYAECSVVASIRQRNELKSSKILGRVDRGGDRLNVSLHPKPRHSA